MLRALPFRLLRLAQWKSCSSGRLTSDQPGVDAFHLLAVRDEDAHQRRPDRRSATVRGCKPRPRPPCRRTPRRRRPADDRSTACSPGRNPHARRPNTCSRPSGSTSRISPCSNRRSCLSSSLRPRRASSVARAGRDRIERRAAAETGCSWVGHADFVFVGAFAGMGVERRSLPQQLQRLPVDERTHLQR